MTGWCANPELLTCFLRACRLLAHIGALCLQILRDLTFSVDPGQSVAIVGPSGSGKSTVLKLLARLYRPERGTVRVAGQDVAQLRQESLRSRLAVVPQDTVLFNDSILENVRRPDLASSQGGGRPA